MSAIFREFKIILPELPWKVSPLNSEMPNETTQSGKQIWNNNTMKENYQNLVISYATEMSDFAHGNFWWGFVEDCSVIYAARFYEITSYI